jgi:hypothetical protein
MIINFICPACKASAEYDSLFTVRAGDRFTCTCLKTLCVTRLLPFTVEEVIPNKSYVTREKKV